MLISTVKALLCVWNNGSKTPSNIKHMGNRTPFKNPECRIVSKEKITREAWFLGYDLRESSFLVPLVLIIILTGSRNT